MTTVKEILIEALHRSNLCPRKRSAPADLLESAYRLFKGLLQKYNFSNFISYTRNEMEVIPTDEVVLLAAKDDGINSIVSIEYKLNEDNWNGLRFVAYEQFYTDNDNYVYSWKYNADGNIEVYFKPSFVKSSARKIKIQFNKNLDYELEDQIAVPSIYIELFTAALTYKLAVTFPRTDGTQVALLKNELDDIEKQVQSLISSNKILTRDPVVVSNRSAFLSGSFLGI